MKNFTEPVVVIIAVLISLTGAKVIYVQVEENVRLAPPVSDQKHYISWHFDREDGVRVGWMNPLGGRFLSEGEPWRNRVSWLGDTLIIKDMRDGLFGTFYCKVDFGSKSTTTVQLIKLSVTKPDSPMLPGERLSLGCDVTVPQGHKKPDIYWLNPQNQRVKGSQGTLDLTAERQHSGSWTCVIGNEKRVKIVVPLLDLAPAPERLYTSVNSQLTIPCSIPSYISWEQIKKKGIREVQWHFSPNPSSSPASDERQRLFFLSLEGPMTWKKDQDKGLRPVSDPAKGNLSLSRSRAGEKDRGDYICSMTFENNVSLNRTVRVQVLQMTSSAGTEVTSGQRVNLSCSTGEPLPADTRLKWFPPEESSVLGSDHHASHLAIEEAGLGDGGTWRCELWWSGNRLTSAELMLKIEPKLSVWMQVIICSAAVILIILIIILTVILHRRRQRKKKHLRHRLCQCKHPKPKGFYRK